MSDTVDYGKLSKEELLELKVKDLKEIASKLGLKSNVVKSDLVESIMSYYGTKTIQTEGNISESESNF